MICEFCQTDMPEVEKMYHNGKAMEMCPICALEARNKLLQVDPETAFTGTRAHEMFCTAVKHLGDKAPQWALNVVAKGKAPEGISYLPRRDA